MKSLKIIPEKCTGCIQCELACSWVQTGMFRPAYSVIRVNIFDEQASYAPYTCFQCKEAWCMTPCPVNAIAINRDTGAKVVIEETCVGCGLCAIACPFGTMFYNPERHKAFKCDLCGGDPACAKACPTGAIEFAELTEADWVQPWAATVDERYKEAISA
jgi:anaerobic carbon-monoxide dehydrogenase iron sulfur subunit